MKCPKCSKDTVKIGIKNITQEIKGSAVEFSSESHICSNCKFSFFDNEQANKIALLASNKYRKNHNLFTSDEILNFRKHFKMNQKEFADFIPVGAASIKRWEGIGIQDVSMDQLIRLRCDPVQMEAAAINVDEHLRVNDENGNREFSRVKLKELIKIMLKVCESQLYTNKALFYADFLHFKKNNVSITGSIYRKQNYGPVPRVALSIFQELEIKKEIKKKSDREHSLEVIKSPDMSNFDDSERETIVEVLGYIKKIGHKKLVELSHQEDGWLKTKNMEVISYNYAKKLIHL